MPLVGHQTLEDLDHANLFIVPLDEERKWYRYHHLFADLLRQRLHRSHSEQIMELNQRASEWYENHDFIAEAVEYALMAQNFEHAANLIETVAGDVWEREEHTKLMRWLNSLPEALVHSRPQLCIFHTWRLIATGHLNAAELVLEAAEVALSKISSVQDSNELITSETIIKGRIAKMS